MLKEGDDSLTKASTIPYWMTGRSSNLQIIEGNKVNNYFFFSHKISKGNEILLGENGGLKHCET